MARRKGRPRKNDSPADQSQAKQGSRNGSSFNTPVNKTSGCDDGRMEQIYEPITKENFQSEKKDAAPDVIGGQKEEWVSGKAIDTTKLIDIPIWIQFPILQMKYWSLSGLSKLGSLIGKPIKRDKATATKAKWNFARIQVEVQVHQSFPDKIQFVDEDERKEREGSEGTKRGVRGKFGSQNRGKKREKLLKVENRKTQLKKTSFPNNPMRRIGMVFKLAVLSVEDRKGGNPITSDEIQDFKECIEDCGLDEIPSDGHYNTWSNKQKGDRRISSKLDRDLANLNRMDYFDTKTVIMEEGVSDHSPLLLKNINWKPRTKSFKFCDMWMQDQKFPSILSTNWKEEGGDRSMFKLVQNLKRLKAPLSDLHKNNYHKIHKQVEGIREELLRVQSELKINQSESLVEEEQKLKDELYKKSRASQALKSQQAKERWITEGDGNSKLFFAWVKKRKIQNYIISIQDENNKVVEGTDQIADIFISYYRKILGSYNPCQEVDEAVLTKGPRLAVNHQIELIKEFTPLQVKEAIFFHS
ncbi:unnamed protein product [Cuscuta campestris]|uniref:Uncharacterized protein n=1 Tax=Cuscuta campestris TaxID=132261 RepID=A0A484KAJ8_9ASTE|nr:unnamed protein product [Cuscuta campestris]